MQQQSWNQHGPAGRTAALGESPADVAHWLLPTGRSWQAVAAGYVALVAIVVWPLGPVALGLGLWALRRAAKERTHGRGRATFAVVVGALATLLLAAVLVTI